MQPRKSIAPTAQTLAQLTEIENQVLNLKKERAFFARYRLDIFKVVLKNHPAHPEDVSLKILRRMLDHDIAFVKAGLLKWEAKKTRATQALKNIDTYFNARDLPDEISFAQHAYYAFCLAAFMSGIEPENLAREYDKQVATMVYAVVHPIGKWSIKTELENQNYAKFICHVSDTGLVGAESINQMSHFRLDDQLPLFTSVRLLAVPCNEYVEFDGVKEMVVDDVKIEVRALEVLKHDVIHAAFLKRHHQKNPDDYWERLAKVGELFEKICADKVLAADNEKYKRVMAAFYLWFHEYTTSIFVDGIPEHLPRQHMSARGAYSNEPQILLRIAAKFGVSPELFKNEVAVERALLKSMKIDIEAKENEHETVKAIMKELEVGYAYLDEHFAAFYNLRHHTHWPVALVKRELSSATNTAMSFFYPKADVCSSSADVEKTMGGPQ